MKKLIVFTTIFGCLTVFSQERGLSPTKNKSKFNDLVYSAFYYINHQDENVEIAKTAYCNHEYDNYLKNISDEFYLFDKISIYKKRVHMMADYVNKNKEQKYFYDYGAFAISDYDFGTSSFVFQIPENKFSFLMNCSFGASHFLVLNHSDKYHSLRAAKAKVKELMSDETGKLKEAIVYLRIHFTTKNKMKVISKGSQKIHELEGDVVSLEVFEDEEYKNRLGSVIVN